jgi:hypothetical protein
MTDHRFGSIVLLCLGTGLLACRGDSGPSPTESKQAASTASSGGVAVETAGLRFELPSGWERRQPSSRMRAAEATIPGSAGNAELAVFHFGEGQGGSADANIRRWVTQMGTEPGTQPEQGNFEVGDLAVTWVDVRGTLKASPMGIGPKNDQPDSRLLGAIVEGPGGPWYFKATGPDATLAAQRPAFIAMLRGARVVPGR